jgi:hypothetical protein
MSNLNKPQILILVANASEARSYQSTELGSSLEKKA